LNEPFEALLKLLFLKEKVGAKNRILSSLLFQNFIGSKKSLLKLALNIINKFVQLPIK
jgi:hypothetical protein